MVLIAQNRGVGPGRRYNETMQRVVRSTMLFSLAGIAGLAIAARPFGFDKIPLRFHPSAGSKLMYETSTKTDQDLGEGNTSTNSKVTIRCEVLTADDKGAQVRMTIDDMKTDSTAMEGMVDEIKGKSFVATFDDRARATSLKGDGSELAQLAAGVLGSAGFLGVEFPADPVDVGSTWASKLDVGKIVSAMAPGGSASADSTIPVTYKVSGITDEGGKKLVKVDFTIKGATNLSISGMDMGMNMDAAGTVSVDAATGLIQEETSKGSSTMDVAGRTVTTKTATEIKLKK